MKRFEKKKKKKKKKRYTAKRKLHTQTTNVTKNVVVS